MSSTSVYVSPANTSKLIRAALKAAFPGVTFSVTTKTYSMGASATVSWTDGPMCSEVEAITCQYAGESFDGMTDMRSSVFHTVDGVRTNYGTDYVHLRRSYSVGAVQAAVNDICGRWGIDPVPTVRTCCGGQVDMCALSNIEPPEWAGHWRYGLDMMVWRMLEGKG